MGENQLDYMFGELTKINGRITRNAILTDENFAHAAKLFKKQRRFNTNVVIVAVICTTCLYLNEKRINKLNKKIEELNQTKGE